MRSTSTQAPVQPRKSVPRCVQLAMGDLPTVTVQCAGEERSMLLGAIVSTGNSQTLVSNDLLDRMGAVPMGMRIRRTLQGPTGFIVYRLNFWLPWLGKGRELEVLAHGGKCHRDVLLGRDFLRAFRVLPCWEEGYFVLKERSRPSLSLVKGGRSRIRASAIYAAISDGAREGVAYESVIVQIAEACGLLPKELERRYRRTRKAYDSARKARRR